MTATSRDPGLALMTKGQQLKTNDQELMTKRQQLRTNDQELMATDPKLTGDDQELTMAEDQKLKKTKRKVLRVSALSKRLSDEELSMSLASSNGP